MAICLLAFPSLTRAHPAHAKPVNYPFVVGFERFHSSLDDDDYLAEGGLILLNELNCVACHAPPDSLRDRLKGVEGTKLEGVGSRLNPVDLEMMIRNPRFLKRDTVMPGFFSGPDRELEEVTALTHFLAGMTYEVPDYPEGDVDRGRRMYHRIGCVSCHAPEVGYRPEDLPESTIVELAGLPSVPMNLADLYSEKTLTHFLLQPHQHRPSGRMPDFSLTVPEAADISAYLKAGPERELPQNLTKALDADTEFVIDPDKEALGAKLFVSKQCVACHTMPEGNKSTPPSAPSLAKLKTEGDPGCLSERPVGGLVPFYGLDTVQKRAISNALARINEEKEWNPVVQLDWRLMSLNCYACHERSGKGGPEFAREIYFPAEGEKVHELGRWGSIPPALDLVGAKLTDHWFEKILQSHDTDREVRPYMTTRMPLFRKDDVIPLVKLFRVLDSLPPLTAVKKTEPVDKTVMADCLQCHPVGDRDSANLPGINLALTPKRLQEDWCVELMKDPQAIHPGTPMPKVEHSESEIRGILEYLKANYPAK